MRQREKMQCQKTRTMKQCLSLSNLSVNTTVCRWSAPGFGGSPDPLVVSQAPLGAHCESVSVRGLEGVLRKCLAMCPYQNVTWSDFKNRTEISSP